MPKSENIIFNLGLLFDPQTEKRITSYSQELAQIQNGPYTLGLNSRPHISVLQFQAPLEEADKIWQKVEDLAKQELQVDFKGMAWDHWYDFDVWWIKVLKSQKLSQLQAEAIKRLNGYNFINNLHDRYEPHSTLLAYAQVSRFPAFRPDSELTYFQNLKVHLSLGRSGPIFQYAEQIFPR